MKARPDMSTLEQHHYGWRVAYDVGEEIEKFKKGMVYSDGKPVKVKLWRATGPRIYVQGKNRAELDAAIQVHLRRLKGELRVADDGTLVAAPTPVGPRPILGDVEV